MGRIRWTAATVGAVASLPMVILAILAGWLPNFVPNDMQLLNRLVSIDEVSLTLMAAGLLLAHFSGGALTGRMSSVSPDLNGALCGPFTVFLGIAGYVAFVQIDYLLTFGPSVFVSQFFGGDSLWEMLTDEEMGILIIWIFALALYLPFAALAGFLGGVLGGRLRRESSPRLAD